MWPVKLCLCGVWQPLFGKESRAWLPDKDNLARRKKKIYRKRRQCTKVLLVCQHFTQTFGVKKCSEHSLRGPF